MSDSDDDIKTAVVIDNGSSTCRAGFSGASQPSVNFPTVVGRPRGVDLIVGIKLKDSYVGVEAQKKRGLLSLRYPIEHGIVTNWDDMEKIWHHIFFSELSIDPEEHPILLTDAPMNPKANREKTAQIMFETFSCPLMYIASQPSLTLLASGRHTGIVLHSGAGTTHVVPFYEGYHLPHAVFHTPIAGMELTSYLKKLLSDKYAFSNCPTVRDMVKDIKESLCYVAHDMKHELETVPSSTVDRSYEREDGVMFTVGTERFQCPEAMFDPFLIGQEMPGIHSILVNAVQRCDEDIQDRLYGNVQLSGGSTMFPGFTERLQKEIELLAPPGRDVKVRAPPYGVLSPWKGGSLKAASAEFERTAMTKGQYDEYGPSRVHQFCM